MNSWGCLSLLLYLLVTRQYYAFSMYYCYFLIFLFLFPTAHMCACGREPGNLSSHQSMAMRPPLCFDSCTSTIPTKHDWFPRPGSRDQLKRTLQRLGASGTGPLPTKVEVRKAQKRQRRRKEKRWGLCSGYMSRIPE